MDFLPQGTPKHIEKMLACNAYLRLAIQKQDRERAAKAATDAAMFAMHVFAANPDLQKFGVKPMALEEENRMRQDLLALLL